MSFAYRKEVGNFSASSLQDSTDELETFEPRKHETDVKTLEKSLTKLSGNDDVDVQIDRVVKTSRQPAHFTGYSEICAGY